ncbi:hypothetical protein B296_00023888, partial [Ensete ventricosum]
YCCLCNYHTTSRLPLSLANGSDRLAFVCGSFPSLLLCAAPSTIEGEDRSFLHYRWAPLQLHPATTSSFAAFVAVVTIVHSFLAATVVIRSFLRWHRPNVPPSPLLSFSTVHYQ